LISCETTLIPARRASRGDQPEADRHPIEAHFALIGRVHPDEDPHQRRLAGSVLPDQRVDLTGGQREIHATHGLDATEPLGEAARLEERSHPVSDRGAPA